MVHQPVAGAARRLRVVHDSIASRSLIPSLEGSVRPIIRLRILDEIVTPVFN
jgi:hypothetical protein